MCAYVAHHELESVVIIDIMFIIISLFNLSFIL